MSRTKDIINKFNTKPTDNCTNELEIRYKNISIDLFEKIYNYVSTLSPQVEVEYTMNLIDNNSKIQKIKFANAKAVSKEFIKKQQLAAPIYNNNSNMPYSINLSSECTIPSFTVSSYAFVRFKTRVSFKSSDSKWRYDLTAVKQSKYMDVSNNIKHLTTKLFAPITDDFVGSVKNGLYDTYEVEIEFIGNVLTEDDLKIADSLQFLQSSADMNDEMQYQSIIYSIAKTILPAAKAELFKQQTHRLKQLSNQVISLDKNAYYKDVYPPVGMYMTDKADGIRAMLYTNNDKCYIIRSDSMRVVDAPNCGTIIVDTEEINGKFYIFDVLHMNNLSLAAEPFKTRLAYMPKVRDVLSDAGISVEAKKFHLITDSNLKDVANIVYTQSTYELDGIIITSANDNYTATRNYKWKPYEHNTIDFLLKKCPKDILGLPPYVSKDGYTLYLLFVGISHKMRDNLGMGIINYYNKLFDNTDGNYYPIQFSPSSNPLAYMYYSKDDSLENKIVELTMDKSNHEWKYVKTRTDRQLEKRYYGNDFKVAEMIYLNFIDPFNLEHLWSAPDVYFSKAVDDIYTASNKYKRYVISTNIIKYLSDKNWIIDIAAGRGADLHRYMESKVHNALFIDIDATAIAELIRRKLMYKKGGNEHSKFITKTSKHMTVHTLVADLKTPNETLISDIYRYGISTDMADGIVCNFAFHYMCDTIKHIQNVLIFAAKMLKIGGTFIITVMNGKRVFDLLSQLKMGEEWVIHENNVKKYAIKKLYSSDKLLSSGQDISVLLPFSNEMYDEPLCNVDTLIAEASTLGFSVVTNESMSADLHSFAQHRATLYNKLTSDDQIYIDLHQCIVLKLDKKKSGGFYKKYS